MKDEAKKDSDLSFLAKVYLIVYNIVQGGGWGLILFRIINYMIASGKDIGVKEGVPGLYDEIQYELRVYQTLAFLEVIHCMIGIVRSSPFTTFMQVYSRLLVLWGIIEGVPEVSDSFGLLLAVFCWCISELVRYMYYACSVIGNVPYILLYLRYTLFYVLYPTGVTGEIMLMYTSLPIVYASQQWSVSLPNPCNMSFSYYYFIMFNIALYVPFFPQLYGHMMSQRTKYLFKSKTD